MEPPSAHPEILRVCGALRLMFRTSRRGEKFTRRAVILALAIFSPLGCGLAQQSAESLADTNKFPPLPTLTAQQDHKLMMELLGITSLRPGANPNNTNSPNAVNYDESKANPYPSLPDPL